MSIFYFEALLKLSEESLSSLDKLVSSWDETLRTATKEDFLKSKAKLLAPCLRKKQSYYLNLLIKYLLAKDKEFELIKTWEAGEFGEKITLGQVLDQHLNKFVINLSFDLNIPIYILKTAILYLDNSYKVDKEHASKYVDKFSQYEFASWFNNLPKQHELRDILDLIVIAVMMHRGAKLKRKLHRLLGNLFLKILRE